MSGTADVARAERAVFARGRLAFAAASGAGLPGRFLAFTDAGLRVLVTTSPGLEFLDVVTGVDETSIHAVPDVLAACNASVHRRPTVVTRFVPAAVRHHLRSIGLLPTTQRPIAVTALARLDAGPWAELRVSAAETPDERSRFLDVLLAGYDSPPAVSRFLRAEHSDPDVRCFLAWRHDHPVAAAAMTLHGDVAVLGGAATVPEHRGSGAQAVLLHHRLREAAQAGAVLATATAEPDSVSLRNLTRAGFRVQLRTGWRPAAVAGPRQEPRR